MTEKISVIIPVYNIEQYLEQCLASICHQTYKNLEIIVIDDGSPDNSSLIYKKYAKTDKRIKIIKQHNKGLSAARNAGLANASGDYVHFIDADDYIDLEYYNQIMHANKGINADIIATGVISQNTPNYDIRYETKCVLKTLTEKFIITKALSNCTVWRYIYKRNFLISNNLSFIPGRIFEDMLFIPDAIRLANYVLTVPGVFYHYVYNKNSLLNKAYTQKHKEHYKYAHKKLMQFIDKYDLQQDIVIPDTTTTTFKIFGIRMIKKIENHQNHITKYLLFNKPIITKYYKH